MVTLIKRKVYTDVSEHGIFVKTTFHIYHKVSYYVPPSAVKPHNPSAPRWWLFHWQVSSSSSSRGSLWELELRQKRDHAKSTSKLERKCSIMKYHVEEREESDLKARILYRPCWRRRVLYFLQNGQSSIRCIWTTAAAGHGHTSIGF